MKKLRNVDVNLSASTPARKSLRTAVKAGGLLDDGLRFHDEARDADGNPLPPCWV